MDSSDDETDVHDGSHEFLSKDKQIKWTNAPAHSLSRFPGEQIMHQRPGVTSYAVQRITEIKDSFDLCFINSIKRDVILFTNMEGNRRNENIHNIDKVEFDAYLGLLLLIGMYIYF